ncbi:MAG: hypothetical protein WCK65_14555 [Rhodospirillaceae bacterium]
MCRFAAILMALTLTLMLTLTMASCVLPTMRGEKAKIEPSYVFALGAHQNDVMAMLGYPNEGPRFDRVTQTYELVYNYPFAAIQAENQFPNGTTRSEMVNVIHMFFDRDGILTKMASEVDRWYSSFSELPVQRITVLPRLVHSSGRVSAPKSAPNPSPK